MMTMLHSVWSGGGSAAGRRRSLLALGALLALVASVLAWVTPTQAQNATPPIAIGSVSITTPATATTAATATLSGQNSFDPDDNGENADLTNRGIIGWKWEVVTDAYSWINLTGVTGDNGTAPGGTVPRGFDNTNPNATFTVPSAALAARYGQTIEFRLTVIDDDNPSDTDTTMVTFNINQGPTADIAVSASLKNPMDINWYDDDGNGVRDDPDEVYNVEGIIDGPGENGNADNELGHRRRSPTDPRRLRQHRSRRRPLLAAGHDWDLIYLSNSTGTLGASITAPTHSDGTTRITTAAGAEINYGDPATAGAPGGRWYFQYQEDRHRSPRQYGRQQLRHAWQLDHHHRPSPRPLCTSITG